MNYGNSNYNPMSNQAGYQQAAMMGGDTQQQFSNFQGMPSGPAYSTPVVPMGTGQQLLMGMGRVEESFIENILRYNKGKVGTFYFTYQGNTEWNAMVYQGRIETAGRDHIIISDPASGKRYLLMMANLDWVEFDERINYPHTEISPEIQASMEVSE
ncbi:spore coat protein GerQ [Alkalihalophilus pseudofirmus]|uniref:spore coat protein GerQ n=1 Tax=Alkalihalophilus pseudofirmus TaxID=79885 RepID=UPI00259B3F40|nr:spore coat protein GerQ [Alkalihalophilus pseudofirmus]WEG18974.1 spore coat protein GerQ [Alkalihalophilus pseudofirmus]